MGKKWRPVDKFVKAQFDIDCTWEGLPPVYRIYVNEELFAEREWHWPDCFLTESLQIMAPPGRYQMRIEAVGPNLANFEWWNHRVVEGPAQWLTNDVLVIE